MYCSAPQSCGLQVQTHSSLQLTWTSLELDDELYSLLKTAARGDVALDKCARAVHRLLALILAVQMTATASKVSSKQLHDKNDGTRPSNLMSR